MEMVNPNFPVKSEPMVQRLVVIGLGLIGGSLASAARQRGVCEHAIGVVRRQATADRALELGIVDQAVTSLSAIAPQLGAGDVIFIAVPTLSVASVLAEIHETVDPSVTITDGASVKGSVLEDVRRVYGCIPEQVVLGHPIAGSEQSGVEAANPELYIDHRVILTPVAETGASHLQRVAALWRGVGAEVLTLDVPQHDQILAATSHLPHAIAFSLVDTLAHDSQNEQIFRYAAGGFRDFTRIASSDATMWRDIMLANSEAVVQALDLFSANLAQLKQVIADQDGERLLAVFGRAKAARDHFTQMLAERADASQARLCSIYSSGPLPEVGCYGAEDVEAAIITVVLAVLLVQADSSWTGPAEPVPPEVIALLRRLGADIKSEASVEGQSLKVNKAPLQACALEQDEALVLQRYPVIWLALASAVGASSVLVSETEPSYWQTLTAGLEALGVSINGSQTFRLVGPTAWAGAKLDCAGDAQMAAVFAVVSKLCHTPIYLEHCTPEVIARLDGLAGQVGLRIDVI